MVNDVLVLLSQAVSAVSGWFLDIFTATGTTAFYLVMSFIGLVVSLLLAPLLPSDRGSDTARRKDDV